MKRYSYDFNSFEVVGLTILTVDWSSPFFLFKVQRIRHLGLHSVIHIGDLLSVSHRQWVIEVACSMQVALLFQSSFIPSYILTFGVSLIKLLSYTTQWLIVISSYDKIITSSWLVIELKPEVGHWECFRPEMQTFRLRWLWLESNYSVRGQFFVLLDK